MDLRAGLCFFASIAAFAACSSDPERPAPAGNGQTASGGVGGGGGGGGNDGGAADAGADAQVVCNTIANQTQVIDRVGVNGDPPVSTGGTILDGRYELSSYQVYVGVGGLGGPTGVTARSALVVNAGKMEQVLELGGNTPTTETRTLTSYNATASTLLRTNICPANGAAAQYQFTANDAAILITDTLAKEVFTFAKR